LIYIDSTQGQRHRRADSFVDLPVSLSAFITGVDELIVNVVGQALGCLKLELNHFS